MTRIRTAGLVASTAVLALTLSGCSVVEAFTPHSEAAIYDSAKEFNASDTAQATSCGGMLTTLSDYNDWANIIFTGVSDFDGASLTPPEVIDCDRPSQSPWDRTRNPSRRIEMPVMSLSNWRSMPMPAAAGASTSAMSSSSGPSLSRWKK